jgi:hypothetical protein
MLVIMNGSVSYPGTIHTKHVWHSELDVGVDHNLFSWNSSPSGPGPPQYRGFTITHFLDTPHSVGLLWTSDQPDAETST